MKIINSMMLNRMHRSSSTSKPKCFRRGRSTTSHFLVLIRLLEGVKSQTVRSAVSVFIDFKINHKCNIYAKQRYLS